MQFTHSPALSATATPRTKYFVIEARTNKNVGAFYFAKNQKGDDQMPCPHFDISIRSLGANAQAVTGTAYISCSKLFSKYRGQTENYTYKQRELVHSEIMLPDNVPRECFDRQTLWNSVDRFEK